MFKRIKEWFFPNKGSAKSSLVMEPIDKGTLMKCGILMLSSNKSLFERIEGSFSFTKVEVVTLPLVVDANGDTVQLDSFMDKITPNVDDHSKTLGLSDIIQDEATVIPFVDKFLKTIPDVDGCVLKLYSIYTHGESRDPNDFKSYVGLFVRYKLIDGTTTGGYAEIHSSHRECEIDLKGALCGSGTDTKNPDSPRKLGDLARKIEGLSE